MLGFDKVTVALEDDLDGGPAETMRFGFDDTEYEIDLSAKNARVFRTKLVPFIEHARTPARGSAPGGRRTADSAAPMYGRGRESMASR
jgi:hypothetical protein